MRQFVKQQLPLIVLALAIAGSFGIWVLVKANWEGQPLPAGLSGVTFYSVSSVFDPNTRTHIAWAAGVDNDGHPVIVKNNGSSWVKVYNESNLGEATNPMAVKSITAWRGPESGRISAMAAGDRGLLLYSNDGSTFHLQLQQAVSGICLNNGNPCTIDSQCGGGTCDLRCTNPNDFIDPTTNVISPTYHYFDLTKCKPWNSAETLNATASQTFFNGTSEDRFLYALGDRGSDGVAKILRASGIPGVSPDYLWWNEPYSLIVATSGNPNFRSIAVDRFGGWAVGCVPGGTGCTSSILYRLSSGNSSYSFSAVAVPGLPADITSVAFTQDRDAGAGNVLPNRVWLATESGKIYRYDSATNTLTLEVNGAIGTRTISNFNGIAAQQERFGGNLLYNSSFVDLLDGDPGYPRYWITSEAVKKDKTDAGEDSSPGSPDTRIKLAWDDNALNYPVRLDGFTYSSQPDLPLHASNWMKWLSNQGVNFTGDGLNSTMTEILGTRSRAALRISGFIKIPQDDAYDFRVSHSNGARLFIGKSSVSDTSGSLADFTTPRINDWAEGSVRDATTTAPITLTMTGGWNGTNAYPFVLEWWNGDPGSDTCATAPGNPSACPLLNLQWKKSGESAFSVVPAENLKHFNNNGMAFATQTINQPILPGQSVHVSGQYKVELHDTLNFLSSRDPRRPFRGLAGMTTKFLGGNEVPNLWSMVNQGPNSVTSAPKAPTGWQTVDYTLTNSNFGLVSGIKIECVADYGTVAWCGGDLKIELEGGLADPPNDRVWAVGDHGIIGSRNNGTWSLEDSPRASDLSAVAGDAPSHVWTVGSSDTLMRYTGGNVKGWAWIGGDTADQTNLSGTVHSDDAVGWVSFNCANATTQSPTGTCTNAPFNYGVHLNGSAVCDVGVCSNNPSIACTVSSQCPSEPDDGVFTGHAWFGATDTSQSVSLGAYQQATKGYCENELNKSVTPDPSGRSQRCALSPDCVGGSGPCKFDGAAYQCSDNPSFPTASIPQCGTVSCSLSPWACRPIGWLSFDRNETGNPPAPPFDSGSGPIARLNHATGLIEGWARFLTLKSNGTGWVHFGSNALSCPSAGNPTCVADMSNFPYSVCRDCISNDNGTPANSNDDWQKCTLCSARRPQAPEVNAGDACLQCGTATQSCQGICQGEFAANPSNPPHYCNSTTQCLPGDECAGYGHCSLTTSLACITDGECAPPRTGVVEKCSGIGKTCPACQQCQRWTAALDQSNGQALGWAWSEDFGWMDMSSIRIGNVPWLQTKYGDVYSAKDIGTQSQSPAPSGQFNASYLVLAGGKIINFTSESSTTITSPPQPIYQDQVPVIPLAQKDKANILGQLDYSNIIADRIGATAGSLPDGRPDIQPICNNNLCANDRTTPCTTDAQCSMLFYANGKYGRVTDITTPTMPDAQKFTSALGSFDLEGKVYYHFGNWNLPTNRIIVGKQNGSGLLVNEGNLQLDGNITYGTSASITNDRQLPSLGVLVLGDLTIGPSVTELHGTFYVLGKVTVQSHTTQTLDNQLRVYGAMVAHQFEFKRNFRGSLEQPQPAEVIQYDGRLTANPPPGFQDLSKALPNLTVVTP